MKFSSLGVRYSERVCTRNAEVLGTQLGLLQVSGAEPMSSSLLCALERASQLKYWVLEGDQFTFSFQNTCQYLSRVDSSTNHIKHSL